MNVETPGVNNTEAHEAMGDETPGIEDTEAHKAKGDEDNENEQNEANEETVARASGSMILQKPPQKDTTTRISRSSHAESMMSSTPLKKMKVMKESCCSRLIQTTLTHLIQRRPQ